MRFFLVSKTLKQNLFHSSAYMDAAHINDVVGSFSKIAGNDKTSTRYAIAFKEFPTEEEVIMVL